MFNVYFYDSKGKYIKEIPFPSREDASDYMGWFNYHPKRDEDGSYATL